MFQKPSASNFSSSPSFDEEPTRHTYEQDSVETVVGPSMNVEGDFTSEGNIIIKGSVTGSVETSQTVHIEQGARINASVKAANAVISGQVKGNIRVAEKLEITSSAQILGDVYCSSLAVQPGALIQGKISMDGLDIDVPGEKRRVGARARTRRPVEDTMSLEEEGGDEDTV